MNWLDIVLIIVILSAVLMGIRTGLIGAAFSMLGLTVGWVLASQFSDDLGGFVDTSVLNDTIVTVVSYLIIILLTLVASRLLWKIVRPILTVATLGLTEIIDKLGGIVLGATIGFLLTGVLIVFLGRLTYDFKTPDIPDFGINESLMQKVPVPTKARRNLEQALSESTIVSVFITVTDAIPGGALGFVPWDFQTSLDILEERTR